MKFYLFLLLVLAATIMATPKTLQDVDGSVFLTPRGPFPCEGCVRISTLFDCIFLFMFQKLSSFVLMTEQ